MRWPHRCVHSPRCRERHWGTEALGGRDLAFRLESAFDFLPGKNLPRQTKKGTAQGSNCIRGCQASHRSRNPMPYRGHGIGVVDSDSDYIDYDDGPTLAERRARWEANFSNQVPGNKRRKRKREEHKREARYAHEYPAGDLRRHRLDPKRSQWWDLLQHPDVRDPTTVTGRKFRRKFRLPYAEVEGLMQRAQAYNPKEWKDKPAGKGHGRGPPRHPFIMKVLAALRHLAKGDDYETLEEVSFVSESLLKKFIPAFVRWLATEEFKRRVTLPSDDEVKRSLAVYKRLGFPGCYCEADGVHLAWDAAPSLFRARFVISHRAWRGTGAPPSSP